MKGMDLKLQRRARSGKASPHRVLGSQEKYIRGLARQRGSRTVLSKDNGTLLCKPWCGWEKGGVSNWNEASLTPAQAGRTHGRWWNPQRNQGTGSVWLKYWGQYSNVLYKVLGIPAFILKKLTTLKDILMKYEVNIKQFREGDTDQLSSMCNILDLILTSAKAWFLSVLLK